MTIDWEDPPGFVELDRAAETLAMLRRSTATPDEARKLQEAQDVLHHHSHVARSYERKHGVPHAG